MPSLKRRLSLLIIFLAMSSGDLAFASAWEAIGPYGGHAQKIVMDPSNSEHLYAATKNGQIYQSIDAGRKWTRLPFTLTPASSLNALVINPQNPNELYAGVARNFATMDDAGVFKSEDAGLHWNRIASTKDWSVLSIAVHPKQTNIILAGTEQGVFRSDDAGGTWRQISPVNHVQIKAIVSVAIEPGNPNVIYAGTTHLPWKTSDGGVTWQPIHEGMADDSDVFSIVINSANSQEVIVGVCGGVYRSVSGGARWLVTSGIPQSSRRTHQIVQDPVTPRTLYAATAQGLWKSLDSGQTWKRANLYPYIVNSLVIDPKNPQTLYIATDRSGLLKSVDGGTTFVPSNEGFVNRSIGRLIIEDAFYLTSLYEGDFGGIFTTLDQGGTWALSANQVALQGKNIISFAVSPRNASRMFAGTFDGLLQSADAGKTWAAVEGVSQSKRASGKVYDVAFSDADPNLMYVATDHGLYASTDSGESWNRSAAEEVNTTVYKLSLDPNDSKLIMARTDRGVWLSRNAGALWSLLDLGNETRVFDLAFSFANTSRIFAATSEGLLFSRDDGRSWSPIGNGLPSRRLDQVLLMKNKPEEIYVLRRDSHQMWVSTNAGTNWREVDTHGLEGTALLSMSVAGGQPFVVTENDGVFRLITQK